MTDAPELISALAMHIRTATGGWANQNALTQLDRLVQELMVILETPEDRRKLQVVRRWAAILYNTRRHQRWDKGVASIRLAMLANLECISRQRLPLSDSLPAPSESNRSYCTRHQPTQ